jgi:hypothetical protein
MKAILAAIFLAATCCAFVGCESELPPNPNVQKRFERGVIGDGTLTQPDKSNDPLIKEETRVGY